MTYGKASSDGVERGMDAQDIVRKVEYREKKRIHICPTQGIYGYQIPKGAWHTIEVI